MTALRRSSKQKGFTLLELVIIIAILGILSSFSLFYLNSSREKAVDTKRLLEFKQIEKALAVYFLENGEYPNVSSGQYKNSNAARQQAWEDDLMGALVPDYLPTFVPSEDIPDEINVWGYDSDSSDDYQTYGLSVEFESSSHDNLEQNDGGAFNYRYEGGDQPKYCEEKYPGTNGWSPGNQVCGSGN